MSAIARLYRQVRSWNCAGRSAVLTLGVLAAYGLIAPIAWHISGMSGLIAAGVAAASCWLGASIALVICSVLTGPQLALHALLLGMATRMILPLGIALMASLGMSSATPTGRIARDLENGFSSPPLAPAELLNYFRSYPLAQTALLNYLLIFYPLVLAGETALSLPVPESFRESREIDHG